MGIILSTFLDKAIRDGLWDSLKSCLNQCIPSLSVIV